MLLNSLVTNLFILAQEGLYPMVTRAPLASYRDLLPRKHPITNFENTSVEQLAKDWNEWGEKSKVSHPVEDEYRGLQKRVEQTERNIRNHSHRTIQIELPSFLDLFGAARISTQQRLGDRHATVDYLQNYGSLRAQEARAEERHKNLFEKTKDALMKFRRSAAEYKQRKDPNSPLDDMDFARKRLTELHNETATHRPPAFVIYDTGFKGRFL